MILHQHITRHGSPRVCSQLIYLSLLILLTLPCTSQIPQLDVVGHAKLRGNIDMNHSLDSTSLSIGRLTGSVGGIFSLANLYIGVRTGTISGQFNTFFGNRVGEFNMGSYNTSFGHSSGTKNEGDHNSYFGLSAGVNTESGEYNSFFGFGAGLSNRFESSNSYFGFQSGGFLESGDLNTFIGTMSGLGTKGSRNTFIGAQADQLNSSDSLDRAIAIGHQAKVDCNNCAVFGGTGLDAIHLGIGLTNPESQLHIRNGNLRVDNGSYESNGPLVLHPDVDLSGDGIVLFFNSIGSEIARFHNNGFLGIGANTPNDALDVVGDLDATGCIQLNNSGSIGGTCESDIRLKRNIEDLEPQLDRLLTLRPVRFNWKDEIVNQNQQIGFIAQEVEGVINEMVIDDVRGYKQIKYNSGFQITDT